MATALLFERDDVDEVEDWAERIPKLRGTSILWIDLERPDEKEIRSLVEQLDLSEESAKQAGIFLATVGIARAKSWI